MTQLTKLDQYFKEHRNQHLEEMKAFLSIPSISSLSEHKDDMHHAAKHLAELLKKAGMENIQVRDTAGHPVVTADWLHAEDKPTVLVYGHYDVQPVDPLELWHSAPFEPEIRENIIYGRGSSDDKGQVFMHVKVLEAMLQTEEKLPVNVKVLFEGEEEIGSVHLDQFIIDYKEELAADLVVISDTALYAPGKPAVCYALRGLTGVQINVSGPAGDLHSGLYGGGVQNPIHALSTILASFHDENGSVKVEGFYDDVRPLTEEERNAFAALDFSEDDMKAEAGVSELFGEQGYSYLEQTWARPTLEMNGVFGGFSGEGIKTVLPAKAGAKITCRLVPDQDPYVIVDLLRKHIEANTPAGVQIEVAEFDKGKPFITPMDHPLIQAAGESYETQYDAQTAYIRAGGSIPIVSTFDEILQAPVILMGFGLSTENFHAPNEHFHLENYDKGLRVVSDYFNRIQNFKKI
ncbi:MAG: dipeptidase [Kurthia sp.]